MPSKFLVPLEVPDFQGTPLSTADAGYVLLFIKYGWLTSQLPDGAQVDLVLQRPLDGFTEVDRYANPITASDTVLSAIEKIQRSLSTLKLQGDVTGTAAYVGGELIIETTGGGGIDCTELLNCQVIIDLDGRVTALESAPAPPKAATELDTYHFSGYGTQYEPGDLVYYQGHIYSANLPNDGVTPAIGGNVYWADLGAGNRLRQILSDWNATAGEAQILNKPTALSQFTNDAGFITSFTETDPIFTASAAAAILSADITNWNKAYGWGDHSTAGYITAEADTLNSVTTRGNTTLNTITVGGITATGVTSTIYAGTGTKLRTEANNLVFERESSSGFMKFYINQTTLSPTAKSYLGYNNATLNVVLSNEFSTGNLELRTQDIIRQQIFANGNVVIGSSSPTDAGYKLDVIGSAKVDTVLHMGNSTDARVVIKGLNSDGSIFIGGSSMAITTTALRNIVVSTVGSYTTLTGINNTFYGRAAGLNVTSGASNVFIGSNAGAGVTTGARNVFVTSSDAGNLPSALSNSIHLVAGNGYRSNDASTIPSATHAFIGGGFNTGFAVKDFYFGQMPFTADAGGRLVDIVFYAPSGSGTNIGGAHFTIAGGRGTGTGTPGDIILRTSNTGSSGTAVQTLADRIRIAGGTGNVTVASLAGTGSRMVVADAAGLLSTQSIPETPLYGLQDVITNNALLSQINTVDVDGHDFFWENVGKYSFNSTKFVDINVDNSVQQARIMASVFGGGDAYVTLIASGASGAASIDVMPTGIYIKTLNYSSASVGDVLTLVDASSGEVEFQTASGGGIALTDLSATAPVQYNNTTGVFSITQATTTTDGYLSSTDWNTFNGKQAALVSGTNIKSIHGDTILGSGTELVFDGDRAKYGYEFFNDFLTTVSTSGGTDGSGQTAFWSGAGATVVPSSVPTVRATNQQGFIQFATGTTNTGVCGIYSTTTVPNFLVTGGGEMVYETSVFIPILSTSTERYRLIIGYGSIATNSPEPNGVFFTYDEGGTLNGSVASANWQCLSVANSVRTQTTTSVAVTTSAWVKLKVVINAAGNSAQYFINDMAVAVATHSTNIPTGASQTIIAKLGISKAVGTTARSFFADYIYYRQIYTNTK